MVKWRAGLRREDGSGCRPVISVMAPHHATQGLKHRLQPHRAIDDRERAFAKRFGEAAGAVTRVGLGWPHDDGRRRLLKTAKKLEHARSRRSQTSYALRRGRLHRNREVDDGDVHDAATEELGGLDAGAAAVAIDPKRPKKGGQLVGKAAVPPAAVGQHEPQAAAGAGFAKLLTHPLTWLLARTAAAGWRARRRVGRLRVVETKVHA